jgi:hypothetical protein
MRLRPAIDFAGACSFRMSHTKVWVEVPPSRDCYVERPNAWWDGAYAAVGCFFSLGDAIHVRSQLLSVEKQGTGMAASASAAKRAQIRVAWH